MDSGNSGSIQSSSGGGDEEYDSRAESISAFMNPTGHVGPIPNPPTPNHHHSSAATTTFDPLSNYLNPISHQPPPLQNPDCLINLDPLWPKISRSDPNCTDISSILASASPVLPFISHQAQSRSPFTTQSAAADDNNTIPRASSSSATSDMNHVVRNPKKRSRASRRAPTTVLTTDTTNFRAMVQEFTGIPAAPFTSSSPFPRTRLDLFGTPSSMRCTPLQDTLLRPFAQKVQIPNPFLSSSSTSAPLTSSLLGPSMIDAITSTAAATTTNNFFTTSGSLTNSASNSTTSINYQLPSSELGLLKQTPPQSSGLLSMQNPVLAFQSLLQPGPRYPLRNSGILGSLDGLSNTGSNLKTGNVLDDFGLSHGVSSVNTPLTGLPNLVSSSDGTAPVNENNSPGWADGVGPSKGGQAHLISANGDRSITRNVTNGKINFSASSSNTHGHGDNGSENVCFYKR